MLSITIYRTLKHFERKAEATKDEKVKEEVVTILEKVGKWLESSTSRLAL